MNKPSERVPEERESMPQLVDELDEYLRKPWYRGAFPAALERRFVEETSATRCSHIRFALVGIAALHVLLLVPDAMQGHEMLMLGLRLRVCIGVAALLGGACMVRAGMAEWAEGLLAGVPMVIAYVCDAVMARYAAEMFRDRYFMGAGTLLCIGASLTPLRNRYALACIGCYLLILNAVLFGLVQPITFPKPKELSLISSSVVILYAIYHWRNEAVERRAFVLAERDRIHTKQLAWANRQLTVLSYTDPLTGLANRRFFDDALLRFWEEAMVSGSALSIMMIDIDYFKYYNDALGHAAGDKCLRKVAQAMQFWVRAEEDSLARCGGEEFIAVIPGAPLTDAEQIAERIRSSVEELKIVHPTSPLSKYVTVSVGVATAENISPGQKADVLVKAADYALYTAKSRGRNCVVRQDLGEVTALMPKQRPYVVPVQTTTMTQ